MNRASVHFRSKVVLDVGSSFGLDSESLSSLTESGCRLDDIEASATDAEQGLLCNR